MTSNLTGHTALVTGAGSGIGRALSVALAAAGANVVIAVRRADTGWETAALVEREGATPLVVEMDAGVAVSVNAGVEKAVAHFGGLDIFVVNAVHSAAGLIEPIDDVTEEDWHRQGAVTMGGAYLAAAAAHPHLKVSRAGRFVLMTSDNGYYGAAANTVYAAQKASYRALVKSLAREWGVDGITVNAVSPAALTTPAEEYFAREPELAADFMRQFPLRRMGNPRNDIAAGIVALCSDSLQYVTGQTLFLDGGLYPSA